MSDPYDAVFPYHEEDEETGITNRELFTLVALHAIMMKGEPEDYRHNAIVAVRAADEALAQLKVTTDHEKPE